MVTNFKTLPKKLLAVAQKTVLGIRKRKKTMTKRFTLNANAERMAVAKRFVLHANAIIIQKIRSEKKCSFYGTLQKV